MPALRTLSPQAVPAPRTLSPQAVPALRTLTPQAVPALRTLSPQAVPALRTLSPQAVAGLRTLSHQALSSQGARPSGSGWSLESQWFSESVLRKVLRALARYCRRAKALMSSFEIIIMLNKSLQIRTINQ